PTDPSDPTLNLAGWISSYTGEPLPAAEMRAWVEATVERIVTRAAGGSLGRVLEIGCGTGLLLFRLAPHCRSYHGTDLSAVALEGIRRQLPARGLAHVTLDRRAADDWSGLPPGGFDTVILNSVTQHFPGAAYLRRVVEGAVGAVAPGGSVFIGDVRNLPHLRAFHASVQLAQAPAGWTRPQLDRRVRLRTVQEEELVVDPRFFTALAAELPGIARVEIQLKRGRDRNEMSRFRFDALLHVGAAGPAAACPWVDAGPETSALPGLRKLLAGHPEGLGLRGLPDARLREAATILAWLEGEEGPGTAGELRSLLEREETGLEPEDLWELGRELGYDVEIRAGDSIGLFDAFFLPSSPSPGGGWEGDGRGGTFTNNPLQGLLARKLVPRLRAWLAERLPEPMLPSALVLLDALPLTANGKVDRAALPAPDGARPEQEETLVAPQSSAEQRLAAIWCEVLGLEQVGVHDNFFSLGGDSILSIQVIARAQQAGLHLTPRQLFQHQTIAELALLATDATAPTEEQGPVTGPVPLTPIQRWFFEQELADPHHWNLAVLLELRTPVAPAHLDRAVAALLEHHDALRLRFHREPSGWTQHNEPPGGPVPCTAFDLSALPAARQTAALEAAAGALQQSLDLAAGPLQRFALFHLGPAEPDRLLATVHHLVIDGVSWRILLEDLQTALRQLAGGEAVRLPPKTNSYRRWSETLSGAVRSAPAAEEAGFRRALPLPGDGLSGENLEATAHTVQITLEADETQALLREAPQAFQTRIDDVLLTALARAFRRWTGQPTLLLDLEGHGRDGLPDLDLSRTVGWFTTIHPVLLETGGGAPEDDLRAIKEQLRQRPAATVLPPPQVIFNNLGQFDALAGEGSLILPARESFGATRSPRAARRHLLEIYATLLAGRLVLDVEGSTNIHRTTTLERLAGWFVEELRELIRRCRTAHADSDLEEVYQLTPLQQGMLFHHLRTPEADVYVVQFCLTLTGPLHPQALAAAWDRVLALHPVLRTSFHWEKLQTPTQVVHRQVRMPIETRDVRGQALDLAAFLAADRRRGFDVTQAPLLRLSVLRTGAEEHLLIWTHHHLLLDGWSVALVVGQVLSLYEALARGESREIERSRPFREYVAWLRRQDLAATERFWRQELAGFTAPTPLGARAAFPEQTGTGDRTVRLSPAASAALQALARAEQLTVNTLAQGAWALLLSRHGGTEDVLFGVTVSGRPAALPGVETMVGLFINTLPLRAAIAPDGPAVPWLRRLQEHQATLRQHEHSPLFEVQRWSEVPAGTPLFHSLFVFENFPTAAERRAGPGSVEIREMHLVEASNYPLTLAVTPGAALALRCIWDRARFDEAEIRRLQEHLRTLLESLAAHPHEPLGALEMMPAAERHQLLVEWNDTGGDLPAVAGLHLAFAEHAARTPDAPALTWGERTLTYAGLDRAADAEAERLRADGVGPGSIVPLSSARTPELIVGMLAILKTGAAYLPIDPSWPQERVGFVRGDGEAPGERAYVLYTSGSTGRPKGVEVPHAAVLRLVRQGPGGPIDFTPGQVWLQLAPAAFDASTLEIWGALANGAHLVLAGAEPTLEEIAATIRRQGVTSLWLTAGLFHQMVERGLDDLSSLRQLLAGGDVLSAPHVDAALRQLPGLRLLNGYGPTENTVFTSCHRAEAPLGSSLPIGRPIPGTRIVLLDAQLRPVPHGAPGRLLTGGSGLARGYLRRPDLTAERFLPDPFAPLWGTPGARLYDTGDLARRRPDGALEFLGRRDAQVKIRGHRVEPGEVEAVLREHPEVADAVVLARPDPAGGLRLVAWVVSRVVSRRAGADLRAYLEERLPAPLIPSLFVALDALPLTANGKVDRRALTVPDAAADPGLSAGPRSPTEEVLAEIWGEVLGLDRVGIDEGFFDRGGHSLGALQVVSRVRKTFGVELPLRDLFEAPTITALARRIEERRRSAQDAGEPPLAPLPPGTDAPLSFAQQRLWFLDRFEPGRPTYNIPLALRLTGDLDPAALEGALAALAARHEALCTTFPEPAGEPVQRIGAAVAEPLRCHDLRGLPEPRREAEARRLAREEALAPFDLARGPLLRTRLLRLAVDEHLLLLTVHHIVSDG
ncbi:MAG TPA: hypothetical protein DD490_24200, partial [Acidobacteria bacterium]|nr:hypothetical protein [Acidobacteriota bacterium]